MVSISNFSYDDFCKVIREYAPCMDNYLYVYDLSNDRYYISPDAVERFAFDYYEFSHVNVALQAITNDEDFPALAEDLQKLTSGEHEWHDMTYRWHGRDGHDIWINCRGTCVRGDEDGQIFMIGCINEVGKHQIADNQSGFLTSVAMKDSIERIHSQSPNGSVLCVGIDDLTTILERIGSTAGEKLTRVFADCIRRALMPGQQAYRLERDDFIIIDFCGGAAEQAKELYRTIRSFVDEWIEQNNYEVVFTISGGIVMGSDLVDDDYDSIIKKAQFALHQAYENGKNASYCYNQADYERFVEERKILREMKKAIANNFERFEVFYQPIMESGTEKLYAAESLLRFTMSDGRAISPAQFIPLLEESGLIIPVGRWVLDQALDTCKECQKYKPDFKVSVNFSYVQILKTNVCKEVINVLHEHGLTSDSLIVEMTESGHLEESPSVKKVWDDFHDNGIMIAIDDFGTGYSNLSSIGMILPNIVKLDRGFTVKAMKNSYEQQLMDHVIQLVHSIDLKICVEGVETPSELDAIEKLNADCIQGYYYGKPCERNAFMQGFIMA